jgi:enediyne biosynthesis thioesterase
VRELFLRERVPGFSTCCKGAGARHAARELRVLSRARGVRRVRIHAPGRSVAPSHEPFEYWRSAEAGEELAARGEQDLACMRRRNGKVEPEPWPESLREALRPYAES